jgi:hypothetical protein
MKIFAMLRIKLQLHHTLLLAFVLFSACAQAETTSDEISLTTTPAENITPSVPEEPAAEAPTAIEKVVEEPIVTEETSAPVAEPSVSTETQSEEVLVMEETVEEVEEEPLVVEEITPESTVEAVEETEPVEIPDPAPQTAPSHKIWDGLLTKHVSAAGVVDYAAMKANQDVLQSYLDLLADNPPRSDWSRNERMAYWINAYNAFTVKMIIDNYPVSSIKDLYGGKPWDVKWIKLGNQTYSLNQIENDILRPIFKDARIHFAVNCAATSCPPLYNHAFTASSLNSQLEQQTTNFINNPSYNMLKADAVEVSKIFEWYGSDFGSLIPYLNKYSRTSIENDADISFMYYDWQLNGK